MAAKRQNDEDIKRKKRRHYISLVTGEDDYVDEEDDYDLDGLEFEDYSYEPVCETKKEKIISDICFFGGLLITVSAVIGIVVLLGRLIAYPFVRKAAKDFDW